MKLSKKKLIILLNFLVIAIIGCCLIYNFKVNNEKDMPIGGNKIVEDYAKINNCEIGYKNGYTKMYNTMKELRDNSSLVILAKVTERGGLIKMTGAPHIVLDCTAEVCDILYGKYDKDNIELKQIVADYHAFDSKETVFPVIKDNKILQNHNYYLLFVNKVDESYMLFSSPQRTTNLGIKDYSDNVSFKIDNDSLPIHGMKFKIKNILDILKH